LTRQELEDKEQEEYLAEWLRKKKEKKKKRKFRLRRDRKCNIRLEIR